MLLLLFSVALQVDIVLASNCRQQLLSTSHSVLTYCCSLPAANERTFLRWLSVTVTLGGLASGLLGAQLGKFGLTSRTLPSEVAGCNPSA